MAGQNGRGALAAARLVGHPLLAAAVVTYGKAHGGAGAVILCGTPTLRAYLVNYARPLVYSTAPPPVGAAAILASFLLQSLLFNQYYNAISVVQVRARAALVGVVFEKALCLAPDARATFSSGGITNLMASDARRVADLALVLNMVWSSALQVVVALVFLVRLLGPAPTFVGLALLSVSMPVQGWVISRMKRARERAWAFTDARIKVMDELLSSMKLVKLYAWETAFAGRVTSERVSELAWIRTAGLLSAANMTQVTSLPIVLSTTAFVTYALLGNRLDAAVVFPAIALFNVLRPPLLILPNVIVSISQASASVDRMERFLSAAELPPRNTGGGESAATRKGAAAPRYGRWRGSGSHGQQLRFFGRNADGAMLLKPRRDQVSRKKSAGPRQRATALPCFPRFAINESGDRIQFR